MPSVNACISDASSSAATVVASMMLTNFFAIGMSANGFIGLR
jgi:hypothetical protein